MSNIRSGMINTSIVKIKIRFTVDRDIVIPPYSSKTGRSIMIIMLGKDNPIFTYGMYKPYVVSPIFINDKPLIRKIEGEEVLDPSNNLMLNRNKEYSFYLTVIGHDIIPSIINNREIKLFDSNFSIVGIDFTLTTFNNLMFTSNDFIMRFITPALLQLPKKWGNKKRAGNFLFPVPSLMLWSIMQHWNRYAPNDLKIDSCKRLAVYSNFSMIEMDYNIKPITVVYNKVNRPKGITGWVRWHIDDSDGMLTTQLKRILAYAQYMGVGRSRSIGFGIIELIPKSS